MMPLSANTEQQTEAISRPRIVIGAPQGRSGKTTVALSMCAAYAARGLGVQPFKKGPDYIDPSWLSAAAGHACRSLDPFFFDSDSSLVAAFVAGSEGADLSLVEGNHGLYDSQDEDGSDSTAAVARILKAPVILVVNTARMSRSVAALVHGYQTFEAGTRLAGVILNNVAQARHESRLRAAIERHCGIPVLGALPRADALSIPDRHLGLVPRAEDEALVPALESLRQAGERYIDLEAVLALARSAERLPAPLAEAVVAPEGRHGAAHPRAVPIGIFRDRAFTFYYPENLESLAAAGAELLPVDAFHDHRLPRVGALYIGGGFPEIFMAELEANVPLRRAVREAAGDGMPIYAECGGLMYLARRIRWEGRAAEMAGVLPLDVEVTGRPQGHGYVIAEVTAGHPFLPEGTVLRGHEFHNSRITGAPGELTCAYHLIRGIGLGGCLDAVVWRNVVASYTHLHVAGAATWPVALVAGARSYLSRP